MGRSFGLTVAEELGASIGDNAVPSATFGVQFGAVSGVALLWQFRRRKVMVSEGA